MNPDFGQVEADPSVLNLTAYETFYEEKRPFFLEGRKILKFDIEDEDQLFYSRRVGQPPSLQPPAGPDETVRAPESTTILGAIKVTGKTNDGLSVAVLQSFTQKEHAEVSSPAATFNPVVEPFGSYTAARVQKDWNKGNTILGGMVTSTHRWISDPSLAFLPTQAWSGGVDFVHYFDDRFWVLDAKVVGSHVEGDREAIHALRDEPGALLSAAGRHPPRGRRERDLARGPRRVGALRHVGQGPLPRDVALPLVLAGPRPQRRGLPAAGRRQGEPGLPRLVGVEAEGDLPRVLVPGLAGGPVGLRRPAHQVGTTGLDANATFENKWGVTGQVAYNQLVDTRGPLRRARAAVERLLDDLAPREQRQRRAGSPSP